MKKIIFAALAVIALSSCAKIENSNRSFAGSNEITFLPAGYLTKTVQGVKFEGESFGTYAYSAAVVDGQLFMDNEKVTLQNGTWRPVGTYYWPKVATVDFISYFPYDAEGKFPTVTETSIDYTDYVVSGDVDLLYASKAAGYGNNVDEVTDDLLEGSVESGYNGVPTLFHHALAKISVNAKAAFLKDSTGVYEWKIKVASAELAGIANKGSLSLPLNSTTATGIVDWTLPESKVWTAADATETVALASASLDEAGTSYALVSDRYVLPQTLSEDGQAINLSINIDTYRNGTLFLQEVQECTAILKTASIAAWQINQNIVYNITLTPALTRTGDDGDEPVGITLDPAIVDWNYVAADVEPVKPTFKQKANQIIYTTVDGNPLSFSAEVDNLDDFEVCLFDTDIPIRKEARPIASHIVSNLWDGDLNAFILTLDDDVENVDLTCAFLASGKDCKLLNVIDGDFYDEEGNFQMELFRESLKAAGITLESVVLPEGEYDIPQGTFGFCPLLESVTLNKGCKKIGSWAFAAVGLEEFIVESGLEYIDRMAFYSDYNLKTVNLGTDIIEIGDASFCAPISLQSVVIPSSKLKKIGESAFYRCENLENLSIADGSDIVLGQACFSGCSKLVELVVPEGVSVMTKGAFVGNSAMVKVVLPSTIQKIESCAMEAEHDVMRAVICKALVPPVIEEDSFHHIDMSLCTLYVPAESLSAYEIYHDPAHWTFTPDGWDEITIKSIDEYTE